MIRDVSESFTREEVAMVVGSSIVDNDAIERDDYEAITANARAFVEAVEDARPE